MSWFCANLVFVVKLKDRNQDVFPIFETSFLISADDWESAINSAREIGLQEEQANIDIELSGRPAKKVFLGVRKMRLTHNLQDDNDIGDARPDHGTELIDSYFEVASLKEAQAFAEGNRSTVTYVDDA